MNTLKAIYANPTSLRIHRRIGAVALLIAWSFFGTTHPVMHTGSFLEALFVLGGSDAALCLWLYADDAISRTARQIDAWAAEDEKADEKKNDMGRAA